MVCLMQEIQIENVRKSNLEWIILIILIPVYASIGSATTTTTVGSISSSNENRESKSNFNMQIKHIEMISKATDQGSYPINILDRSGHAGCSEAINTPVKPPPGWLEITEISFEDWLKELRNSDVSSIHFPQNGVLYFQSPDKGSYAIMGSDADGVLISGVGGKVLVLSNQ